MEISARPRTRVRDAFRFHRPSHRARSLSDISEQELCALGIRAALLDMDNTLSTWRGRSLAPDASDLVARLSQAGLALAVFSNNQPRNVTALAEQLGIEVAIARAGKPNRRAFIKAAQRMNLPPSACAVIGDQLMTDIVGARRAGFGAAILVRPLTRREWVFTKFNRFWEAVILRISGQRQNK